MLRLKEIAKNTIQLFKTNWGFIAFGIFLFFTYRIVVFSVQILPKHPWDIVKLFLPGLCIDFAFWLFILILLKIKYIKWFGLLTGFLFIILNMVNLGMSHHYKDGMINFSFLLDYLEELEALAKTGTGLIPFWQILLFLIIPLIYLIFFISSVSRRSSSKRPEALKVSRKPGYRATIRYFYQRTVTYVYRITAIIVPRLRPSQALSFLIIGFFLFFAGQYIQPSPKNILSNNVVVRMIYYEWDAYLQKQKFTLFAKTLEKGLVNFPDKEHFEKIGFKYPSTKFPLYKIPSKIKIHPEKTPNIVIIILESVAAKDTGFNKYTGVYGRNFTPFMNSLMKKSLIVPRFFSNADYTAGAESAIFCSIHDSLRYSTGAGSILRTFTYNKLLCIPQILKSIGYQTLFFHSYTATFDNKDKFFPENGVDEIIDKDHKAFIGKKQTYWGISDKEMFIYGVKHLSLKKEPFMASFLTVNNHPPFILHDKKDEIDTGEEGKYHDYLNTVHFTDTALKTFFERAKKTKWFKNTIFFITSDNGIILYPDRINPISWSSLFKMWHMVPMLIYSENKHYNFKGKVLDLPSASHIDIPPTILDILGISIENPFAGESLFSKERRDYTFIYDWFGNYYRLSWPYLFHNTDSLIFNLVKEKLSKKYNKMKNLKAEFHLWVENNRNFFNYLTYKNKVWPLYKK